MEEATAHADARDPHLPPQAFDVAVQNGAKVINLSLGGASPGSAFVNAIARAADQGIIVVIAAGNESEANPSDFALVANNASAKNMVIIAGSHDEAGANLSTFSNAAGSGQQHYLVALGESVRTINHEGTAVAGDGTSFATPQIAGAAARSASRSPNRPEMVKAPTVVDPLRSYVFLRPALYGTRQRALRAAQS